MNTIKRIALSLIPGLIAMVLGLIVAFLLNEENAWYVASIGGVSYGFGWYVALTYWKDYHKKPMTFFLTWTMSIVIPLLVMRNWLVIEITDIVFSMCMFWNSFVLKYFIILKKNKKNS